MALLEQELEALEMEAEGELEGEAEGETGLEGEGILGTIGNVLGGLLGESEFELESEFEGEAEGELEGEINPVRKVYADAMMEHMAHMAAEAETEQEAAEHFLPLIGMAASKLLPVVAKAAGPLIKKALPRVAQAVTKVTPRLTRGVTTIARGLHRNPATRRLLHAVPSIARRTVHSVARQAAQGRPVTNRTAVRTLAQQTRRVLARAPQRIQTLRRSRAMDRHFHRRAAPGVATPHTGAAAAPGVAYGPSGPVGVAAPGVAHAPGAAAGAVTPGGWVPANVPAGSVMRTGAVVCPPCPRCNGPAAAAAPSYCRCCGQVLR